MAEENAVVATQFLSLASSGNTREAWDRYAATDFIHHNPHFPGDGDSLRAAMEANAAQFPAKRLDVIRTIAEGNLVAVHSHVRLEPDQAGLATVHLCRIEGGRIRELWDVAQEVPSESPNEHGMF